MVRWSGDLSVVGGAWGCFGAVSIWSGVVERCSGLVRFVRICSALFRSWSGCGGAECPPMLPATVCGVVGWSGDLSLVGGAQGCFGAVSIWSRVVDGVRGWSGLFGFVRGWSGCGGAECLPMLPATVCGVVGWSGDLSLVGGCAGVFWCGFYLVEGGGGVFGVGQVCSDLVGVGRGAAVVGLLFWCGMSDGITACGGMGCGVGATVMVGQAAAGACVTPAL